MIKRYYLKEIPVDAGSRVEIRQAIRSWLIAGQQSRQVVTLNGAMLISALNNLRLKQIIQTADLVTVDGYSILLALKKRGLRTERSPGVELADELIKFCVHEHLPVYSYGGTKETALKMQKGNYGNEPVLIRDGFGIKEDLIREEIIRFKPKLILAGLGSPRQEFFLAELLPELKGTVGIGIGGALEIISGQKRRAPAIFTNHGWEWCYRMIQDPKKIKLLPELVKFWYQFLR